MNRVHNFNAGPAILPMPVLEEASKALIEFENSGMSILEVSHRGKHYEAVHNQAQSDILKLMGLNADDYAVMFIQGGASMQFAMLPMNYLRLGATAEYVVAGEWGTKAVKEAKKVGKGVVLEAASSADSRFSYIPRDYTPTVSSIYFHVTTNNTIEGTQWFGTPESGGVPLVADMSSDFLSMKRDFGAYSLIYAGAQKNAGPAGVTVVLGRKEFLGKALASAPAMLSYKTYLDSNSLYNTPPCFAVYVVGLVARWALAQGGLNSIEHRNREKAGLLYKALDELGSFYRPTVSVPGDRSLMNVTFTLQPPYAELEKEFLTGAEKRNMVGLAGHRSVGGFRASIYNAFPPEGVTELVAYIREFAAKHG